VEFAPAIACRRGTDRCHLAEATVSELLGHAFETVPYLNMCRNPVASLLPQNRASTRFITPRDKIPTGTEYYSPRIFPLGEFAKVDNRFGYEKWLQGGCKGLN
jgi:hypothetical protein